jgi:hypothetical protein
MSRLPHDSLNNIKGGIPIDRLNNIAQGYDQNLALHLCPGIVRLKNDV